ncbi:hypothetical protein LTR94_025532, partial [Friedmanniomyces endolithicus]
ANKKVIDLDALEKLADQLVFWGRYASETEDQAKVRRNECCREASGGIKALVSELREARRLLTRIDRVYADLQDGNGNHPTELRKVRAFLSRNGKGEGG